MKELLQLLKQNARLSNAELAVMMGKTEAEVAAEITELERAGVIRGYSVILDEELADRDAVSRCRESPQVGPCESEACIQSEGRRRHLPPS